MAIELNLSSKSSVFAFFLFGEMFTGEAGWAAGGQALVYLFLVSCRFTYFPDCFINLAIGITTSIFLSQFTCLVHLFVFCLRASADIGIKNTDDKNIFIKQLLDFLLNLLDTVVLEQAWGRWSIYNQVVSSGG